MTIFIIFYRAQLKNSYKCEKLSNASKNQWYILKIALITEKDPKFDNIDQKRTWGNL